MPARKLKKVPKEFKYNGYEFTKMFASGNPGSDYINRKRKIYRKDGYYTKVKKIGNQRVLYISKRKKQQGPSYKVGKPKVSKKYLEAKKEAIEEIKQEKLQMHYSTRKSYRPSETKKSRTKKIDGKIYTNSGDYNKKADAQRHAESLRKSGYRIRVVPNKKGSKHKWGIWKKE